MQHPRRAFLHMAAGAVALPAVSRLACAQTPTVARGAIALRSALQSLMWIGVESGIYKKHGLDLKLTLDTGGPRSAAGTLNGDWEFGHTGDTPVVQGVLQGQDPVVIVGPAEAHDSTFLMARRGITKPQQLAGARIGGVDAQGQFGKYVEALLDKWGVSATVLTLGSYQAIYKALGSGEIDAAYLPVHLRHIGETEFGWNMLAGLPSSVGGIVTSRRLIKSDRALVSQFVRGTVETIALLKTKSDAAVPMLQKYLQVSDRKAIEQLHAYYVPILRAKPRPTLAPELPRLKDLLAREYPAVASLRDEDLCDTSFVDELERTGDIDRLYRTPPR